MKNQKTRNSFFSVGLMVIGFIVVLGSAGALEVGNIGIGQTLIQFLIGAGITYVGFYHLENGGF